VLKERQQIPFLFFIKEYSVTCTEEGSGATQRTDTLHFSPVVPARTVPEHEPVNVQEVELYELTGFDHGYATSVLDPYPTKQDH